MPFVPGGASGARASTKWMMLSAMSCSPQVMKIFVPFTRHVPSASGHALAPQRADVGPGLRLGERHRARPFPVISSLEIDAFNSSLPWCWKRFDGTGGEHRAKRESHV